MDKTVKNINEIINTLVSVSGGTFEKAMAFYQVVMLTSYYREENHSPSICKITCILKPNNPDEIQLLVKVSSFKEALLDATIIVDKKLFLDTYQEIDGIWQLINSKNGRYLEKKYIEDNSIWYEK